MLETNPTLKNVCILLRLAGLSLANLGDKLKHVGHWHVGHLVVPQFRGPESNPVGTRARLAERWSKTENVEWSQEIPG